MNELIRTISALSLTEKAELNKAITRMIANEGADADLVDNLKERICNIMDIPFIDVHSRKAENMIGKILLSNALLEFGKSEVSISYTLGLDHTTINYHHRIMQTWKKLPMIYSREMSYWKKLREQICD